VKKIHSLIDIRRHRGDSNFIIGLINRFKADLPVVGSEWLVRADQAALVPQDSIFGQADSNDLSWAAGIATRIRQLSQSGEDLEFLVLSYDGYLLNSAERLVYSDNLPVKTKHLGELMNNSWTLQQTGRPVEGDRGMPPSSAFATRDRKVGFPPAGGSGITVEEAIGLMKTMLRRGGYLNRGRAIPQKDVRLYMATMDPRAARIPGDFESESLIRNIVMRGLREGWLVRFNRVAGKGGTEMLYLVEDQAVSSVPVPQPQQPVVEAEAPKPIPVEAASESTLATQPVVEVTTVLEVKTVLTTPVVETPKKSAKENLPERTAAMEGEIQLERIGSLAETREYFLDAIESILKDKGDEVLVVSHLFSRAENMAKKRASETGYVAEQKWGIAKRCIQRLVVRAGVLLTDRDGEQVSIFEGLGDESAPVCGIIPDFRMVCFGYLAETIIRRLGKIHFKDDYFYLGMALFRRGKMNMVDSDSLRIEADKVLAHLLKKGRIELIGNEIRLSKQPTLVQDRIRVVGA